MAANRQVLVIGGGVVGLCSAWYARQKGFTVAVVNCDASTDAACSFGNAGMIVPSHFVPLAAPGMVALGLRWMWNPRSPFYIRPRLSRSLLRWGWLFWRSSSNKHVRQSATLLRDLHLASRAEFIQLTRLLDDDFGLTRSGMLMLCRTRKGLEEEARLAERARSLGLHAKVLSQEQLGEYEPEIALNVSGAVYVAEDCHLVPQRFMAALRRKLEECRVEFIDQAEATGWRVESGRVVAVTTSSGEIEAESFLLAAGVWSSHLAAKLGIDLPMQAGKGYSLTLEKPPRLPRHCAILTEARVAVTPMANALRFSGTMEMSGLHSRIDARRVEGIVRSAVSYMPDFRTEHFRGVKPWQGLRPCSPDGLPYLGKSRKFANLFIAAGHAMMGLSLAPISGRIFAESLASGDNAASLPENLRLLNPERFFEKTLA